MNLDFDPRWVERHEIEGRPGETELADHCESQIPVQPARLRARVGRSPMPVIHPAAPQLLLEDLARPLASSEDRVGFAKRFADEHPHGCPPCSFEATDGTVAA